MSGQENNSGPAALDLSKLLAPSVIALVGASANPQVTSGQPLRYMKEFGYRGKLYPVNPKRAEVQGFKCYDSVLSIPEPCDVAVITVPAQLVPDIVVDCGRAGIPFAIILSAGFEEAGGTELQARLLNAATESGVRVVGPNSTGIVNLQTRSYCAQGGALSDPQLKPGPVAVVAQSGGVGLSLLAFLQGAGVGTNYLASSGNEIDLDVFDFIEYFLAADDVSVIALYLESSTDGRRIRALGQRALDVNKPIVVLKAGNAGTAQTAATSHTGRLTADYQLFRAAFREGGYVEVAEMDELVDVAKALQAPKRPRGRGAAIQTTSGGWGIMIAEKCEQHGLVLPQLSAETTAELSKLAPPYASIRNPLDMTPQAYGDQYASYNEISRHLLADPAADLLIVRSAPGGDVKAWANGLLGVAEATAKPIFVNWAPALHRYTEIKGLLEKNGIPCISYAGRLARIAAAAVEFSHKVQRARLHPAPATTTGRRLDLPLYNGALGEIASRTCLEAYGIATAKSVLVAPDKIDAAELAGIRFPVAVKAQSADLPHKTEFGGVVLNVSNAADTREAAHLVLERVRSRAPLARIEGIAIQEMASGLEVIVGAVDDPHFGPYVMFGMGGIFAEVIRDVSYRFAPLNKCQALEMVREVRGNELLEGVRGEPPRDIDALTNALVGLSQLIWDNQTRIAEIEINPLFVGAAGAGVVAADCLALVKQPAATE